VSYRGQLLRSGTIVFAPDASRGSRGELACADIQPDGSYVLRTGDAVGAAPGWHRVTVCSLLASNAPLPGQPAPLPVSALPAHYRDPQLSGLACEVKAGESNSIDIHLD
jgi:hypothetical protein